MTPVRETQNLWLKISAQGTHRCNTTQAGNDCNASRGWTSGRRSAAEGCADTMSARSPFRLGGGLDGLQALDAYQGRNALQLAV